MAEKDDDSSFPSIEDMVERLDPIKALIDDIDRIVVDEETISSSASAKLASIRSSLDRKHSSIREKVNSIITSNSKYLQDKLSTIRNGRHVVPVKSEYKSQK